MKPFKSKPIPWTETPWAEAFILFCFRAYNTYLVQELFNEAKVQFKLKVVSTPPKTHLSFYAYTHKGSGTG